MPLLEVRNLVKEFTRKHGIFGAASSVRAVDGVSFSIEEGETFGLVAIASALLFVTRKSPVAAALWLVNTMFSLAALYVMLDAQFVGAVQVLVYAGAIMVVFLFVVMLLNLGHASEAGDFRDKKVRLGAGAVAIAMLAELLVLTRGSVPEIMPSSIAAPSRRASPKSISVT